MRLRPFISDCDFDVIKNWISDERTYAMWCAGHMKYPMEKENFDHAMLDAAIKFGESPYVVTTDDGKAVGFFCYSVNLSTNEGMLRFIMVDPSQRGKGVGKEMLRLAVKYAFHITKVNAVQLNVFPKNERALKCYERVGFAVRRTDSGAFCFKEELWDKCNMVIRKKCENRDDD